MISKYKYKGLLWVDLESPRREEIESILEEFNLPEDLAPIMQNESKNPRTDIYPNLTYLVLHFPLIKDEKGRVMYQEINFIIGKNFLITLHYEYNSVLDSFAKKFEAEELLEASIRLDNSASLFYYLIQILNDDTKKQLSHLQYKLANKKGNLITFLCIIIIILSITSLILYLK
ncbi:MAG: magnesium transporter [Patescibacteria group bacterium]|nr:magnesium transporter [Patescibacteria group bacterium]